MRTLELSILLFYVSKRCENLLQRFITTSRYHQKEPFLNRRTIYLTLNKLRSKLRANTSKEPVFFPKRVEIPQVFFTTTRAKHRQILGLLKAVVIFTFFPKNMSLRDGICLFRCETAKIVAFFTKIALTAYNKVVAWFEHL